MEEDPDFYAVLNLSPLATDKEIRKAYLELARVFHPDRAPAGLDAQQLENTFHLIEEAYRVLSDPLLHPIYDKYGKLGLRGLDRFTFMKRYVEQFYTEENEERKREILGQIIKYLNEAMVQELIHEREQIYISNSSVFFAISMKEFCNHAQKYMEYSSLSKALRLISILQAGVDSKITFVALENWKLSLKASNVMENQHSIGAGQIGLKAVYQAAQNAKLYSSLSFHGLEMPSIKAGTKLFYQNYYVKPEVSYSKGEFDYKTSIGGKLFNKFDFSQTYSPSSSYSEVQINLGSKGIVKTAVTKDFSNNTISVTPTWQIHLSDDIINQVDLQLSSNGRLMFVQTLNYLFSAGRRLALQTQLNFKQNQLRSLAFSFIISLEGFTLKVPITLGDQPQFSSMLISSLIALVGHVCAFAFHSFSGRLIHNEKNYVRFLKFASQIQIFQHFESELQVEEARGRVAIVKAYFGEIVAIRNLQRKKMRNFKTPTDCDQYLQYPVYEVTQYLRAKIKDGRRWSLSQEILKDRMLFDPSWRDNKKKCGFYVVVKRGEQIEDLFWNPERQHLLLIV